MSPIPSNGTLSSFIPSITQRNERCNPQPEAQEAKAQMLLSTSFSFILLASSPWGEWGTNKGTSKPPLLNQLLPSFKFYPHPMFWVDWLTKTNVSWDGICHFWRYAKAISMSFHFLSWTINVLLPYPLFFVVCQQIDICWKNFTHRSPR